MNDNNNKNNFPKFMENSVIFLSLVGILAAFGFNGFGSNKKQYEEKEYVQEITTEEETVEYTSEEEKEEKTQNEEIETITVKEEQEADLEEKEFMKNYSKEDLLNSYDEVSIKGDLFPEIKNIKEYKAEDIKIITVTNKDSNEENNYFVTYEFGDNKEMSASEIKSIPYIIDTEKLDKDKINSFVTSTRYQSIFNDDVYYSSYLRDYHYNYESNEFDSIFWDYTLYDENIAFGYIGYELTDNTEKSDIDIWSFTYQDDEYIPMSIKITKQNFEDVFNCESNQVFTIEELKQMEDELNQNNKNIVVKVYEK